MSGLLIMAQEHMIILFILWKNDGASQKSVVNNIFKDKSTITRGLSYLEKENLIVRITDENDKRNKKIHLTHKGKSLQKEVDSLRIELQECDMLIQAYENDPLTL